MNESACCQTTFGLLVGLDGGAENAGPENAGPKKIKRWKMMDRKMTDQIAGVENERPGK
jgi:hypothetical protein